MNPKSPIIKQILQQLNEKYHQPIGDYSQILPNHQDRDEIKDYIQYCMDKKWIEVKNTSIQRGGNRQYFWIKLTPEGLEHLHTIY